MKILIIEDDKVIAENLVYLLEHKHYIVEHVDKGKDGLDAAYINDYDTILLDWMLPDINGNEVCRKLRARGLKTPIIFLTAKTQLEDKVTGLDIGADDYITKPFEIEELLARIRALVRRNYKKNLQSEIHIKDLTIDTAKCLVYKDNREIALSPKLYSLVEFLGMNKDTVVTRTDLLEHLWDENADLFSNVIDVHIKNLRKAFKENNIQAEIKTVKSKGYMLCSD